MTAGIERWEDWLTAWRDNGDLHAGLAREAAGRGWARTAGEAWIRAAVSYHFGKFVWMLDMDAHDAVAGQAVAAMYRGLALLDPAAERIEIPFGGASLVGNLRRPPGADRPPLVLLIAGLDSTKEEFFAVENTFLARGLATFSLDGPGQGESARAVKIRPDFEAPVAAVLDVLCQRADLDGGRVGTLGVSLGGYYAARAAAFEPRLKAVVVCGGCYDYGALIRHRSPHSFATFSYGCGAASDGGGLPGRGADEPGGRGGADRPADGRGVRQARPAGPVAARGTGGRRGARGGAVDVRRGQPRVCEPDLPVAPAGRRLAGGPAGQPEQA